MAEKIKVGVIGLGTIGRVHIKGFIEAGADVVAGADPSSEARDTVKKQWPEIEMFESAEKMLGKVGLDAVVVGIPNKFHAPTSIAALEAGCNVLCEKPIATNAADAKKMVQAQKKAGKVLMIGTQFRLTPRVRKIRELVDTGYFGNIYYAKATYIRQRGIPGMGGWFTTKSVAGGGCIYDIGIHTYDQVWYAMGCPKPVAVSAAAFSKFMDLDNYVYSGMWAGPPRPDGTMDVDDFGAAFVRYENGAVMFLEVSWAANRPNEPMSGMIMGDKRGAGWEGGKDDFTVVGQDVEAQLVEEISVAYRAGDYPNRWRHFIQCVTEGAECLVPGSDMVFVQAVLDAIYESSVKGAEVRINPDDWVV